MTCPACHHPLSKDEFRAHDRVTVCPQCARSIVKDGGSLRLATAEDLRGLAPGQITELRQARPAAWRSDVRAKHARIVGGRT